MDELSDRSQTVGADTDHGGPAATAADAPPIIGADTDHGGPTLPAADGPPIAEASVDQAEQAPADSAAYVLPVAAWRETAVRRMAPLRVVPAQRWSGAVQRLRQRAPRILRHPATVASVSVAATVGTRLLMNGLREAGRQAERLSAAGTTDRPAGGTVEIAGYVLHEVHVIYHHVVHHAGLPDRLPAVRSE